MENIATSNPLLKVSFLICILTLSSLVSCGDYVDQYSENDGAYYDPESDTLPRYTDFTYDDQVGNIYKYDYDNNYGLYDKINSDVFTSEENTHSIVTKAKKNEQLQQHKYQDWGKNDHSDWGKYKGTKIYIDNYYVNTWGNPHHNWYGWNYPYYYPYGYRMSSRFGHGYYYGWREYYDPFWGWSNYPYYPYRHKKIYYRSVPRYKDRDADLIERSDYNYNKNIYSAEKIYESNNKNNNFSKSVENSGGGFRR